MEAICKKAIDAAGGPTKLADLLPHITSQAISQWKRVPSNRVLDVERITEISRHELRPDIFGAKPGVESVQ